MLFKILKKRIAVSGLTDELRHKIDLLYACDRLTDDEYNELIGNAH